MSDEIKVVNSGGIGVFGVTFVVLLVLKLLGYISIGWGWVFAPLWIPAVLVAVIFIVILLVVLGKSIIDS